MSKIINHSKSIIPGLLVCILISFLGVQAGKFFPLIGGATLSILLGIVCGNTIFENTRYAAGSKFAESDLLAYSIVLLGGTLSFATLQELGFAGVGYIVIQMSVTIGAAIYLGKKYGFAENFRFLMASGNAVCGSSAIGSTAPAINASDEDKVISITIVNLTGTVLMVTLPIIASFMFPDNLVPTSALIGGTLQSVGQVVASGSMVNEGVKDLSTIFKIVRIIFLVAVVIFLTELKEKNNEEKAVKTTRKLSIPWYVIGFFILCALYSFTLIPQGISGVMKQTSNVFEIIALAGIGMRVKFKDLIKEGPKASFYGISIACVQIISALTLIRIFFI